MAKKPKPRIELVSYDVVYEDAVKAELEQQDREISEKSGIPPMTIKTIKPSGKK